MIGEGAGAGADREPFDADDFRVFGQLREDSEQRLLHFVEPPCAFGVREPHAGLQQVQLDFVGAFPVTAAFDLFEAGRGKPGGGIAVDFGGHVLVRSREEGVVVRGGEVAQQLREMDAGHC